MSQLLSDLGFDEVTVTAALLHDSVEDSELTIDEVRERFGTEVAEVVAALTEDDRIDDWVDRKNALRRQVERSGARAAAIFAADKLSNLRELRRVYEIRGEGAIDLHKAPSLDLRIAAWADDLEMITRVIADLQLAEDLRLELRGLERERSRPAAGGKLRGRN